MSEKGRPLPKFGEWDVNDPASAEGYTVIFNKARDEKKTGGKPESPAKANPQTRPAALGPSKSQSVRYSSLNTSLLLYMYTAIIYLSVCLCEQNT
ncbi:unnamed protein product [Lupinus luteus]|uniref:RIN4 pathogenic type III effector avirulence factor Avr cleavage site domain-containing protein n=1 Tax=Lupinus luteus TaxID=3873 RepID=A0AAV1X6V0_LUPLU